MNDDIWDTIRKDWDRNYFTDLLHWYPDLTYTDLINAPTAGEFEQLAKLGICSDDAKPLWDIIAKRKAKEIREKKYNAKYFPDTSNLDLINMSRQLKPQEKLIVFALREISNQLQDLNQNLRRSKKQPDDEPVLDSFHYHDVSVRRQGDYYVTFWRGMPVRHDSIADAIEWIDENFPEYTKEE